MKRHAFLFACLPLAAACAAADRTCFKIQQSNQLLPLPKPKGSSPDSSILTPFSMKKHLLLCLLPFIALVSACGQTQANDEAAVAAAVEKLRLAMISAKAADLAAIAADGLLYGHSAGALENKAEYVDAIASGRNVFVTIKLSDQIIKVTGDTAVVRHTLVADTKDGGKPGFVKIGVMQFWKKQNGEWKLLGRQACKL
jgi:ketosteroid isomerase-like protein